MFFESDTSERTSTLGPAVTHLVPISVFGPGSTTTLWGLSWGRGNVEGTDVLLPWYPPTNWSHQVNECLSGKKYNRETMKYLPISL